MNDVSFYEQDWYQQLVDDCKAIVVEAVFTSRWALVEGYHGLGERVRQDTTKWEQNKAGRVLQDLAKHTSISERTLYYATQFYDKYPNLDLVPEGKNISWNKLITQYLPTRIEAPEEDEVIEGEVVVKNTIVRDENADQYEPIVVTDQFEEQYICLSEYEARAIANMIETAMKDPKQQFDTGDWFTDIPIKVRKLWAK